MEQRWRNLDESQRFHARKKDLEVKKEEYQNLPHVQQRKLQQLEKEVYARQLERFLDKHRIDQASISGIGHARKITLRSYGIETAADVTSYAILGVHGFGLTYTNRLLAWRASIERRFVFDPRKGVDPADRQGVEREIGAAQAKLEQELRSGAAELRRISDQAKASHDAVCATAEAAIKTLAQAEADLVASKATSTLVPVFAVAGVALLTVFPLKVYFESMRAGLNRPVSVPKPAATAQPSAAISPTPSAEQTAALAKASYDQGVVLAKAGKFSEAVAAYEQAITLKPDFADSYHELGYVRFRMKEFDEAVTALKQARSLRPKYPETHRVLGQVYEAKGNWTEAAKFYGEAAFLQPKHAPTQYNYGRALKRVGDMDSAIQAMQEAVKLKPDWASAHYELGLTYLATGDREMALEEYNAHSSMNEELAHKLYAAIEKSGGIVQ